VVADCEKALTIGRLQMKPTCTVFNFELSHEQEEEKRTNLKTIIEQFGERRREKKFFKKYGFWPDFDPQQPTAFPHSRNKLIIEFMTQIPKKWPS
jgi:hypothetical protein